MELRPITVLATSVGNDGFPSVMEALRENGERRVTVVGVDVRESAPGLHLADHAALVPPRGEPDALVRSVLALARKHRADALLPLSTEDQPFFAERADFLAAQGLPVVASAADALATANDKLALLSVCAPGGVPCPRHVPVRTVPEVEAAARELGWPERGFVFKLNRGTGAQGVKVVDPALDRVARLFDRDNLRIRYEDLVTGLSGVDVLPPAHLAEYLPGKEYSVDVLCERGRTLVAVVRERLATLYGLATHSVVVDLPAAARAAERVVALLGLSHVVNVQFRCDAEGVPRLLEVNPRIPGTVGLSVAAGVNLPYLAVKQALGEEFAAPQPKIGTELVRTWRTVLPTRRVERW
ncbi:ATP-grasp domain-containing protein [Streptoalloteichus hindustanus]|uniref:Carbamoyl-phosphate synthase large subunit n=1 Tax=Streptoalloteichus hindustanus TaxID=2017 RepID=A0A1M4VIB3_STRHI|nr:ATP-grasp domain-containing protein [Streptoalloteichus hindustanus]SHE68563.1 carbamoyl-phosphate synthase large subunit [Streptoalloteichus hindustanus]